MTQSKSTLGFQGNEKSDSFNIKVNACKSKTYVCEVWDKIVFKILIFGNFFQTYGERRNITRNLQWRLNK